MIDDHVLLESLLHLHRSDTKGSELLSSKGKIVGAMLRHGALSVKEIPDLAGVSCRTCFGQLRELESLGVIEKSVDVLDKRRTFVIVNIEQFRNKFLK